MGILSRIRQLIKAQTGARHNQADNPEKAIDPILQELRRDLGQVKAESASLAAHEQRAKRALDECEAEIRKLQRYAEKAVEEGEDERALAFLQRKASEEQRRQKLKAAYERVRNEADQFKKLEEKFSSDLHQLEAHRAELKTKFAQAQAGAHQSEAAKTFRELEEKAKLALLEAEALAELRSDADSIDYLIEQLEADANKDVSKKAHPSENATLSNGQNPEEELAALKAKLQRE